MRSSFSERVKKERERAGLSQTQLARAIVQLLAAFRALPEGRQLEALKLIEALK